MKYLFVGLGSIGKRHLKNLRSLTKDKIIAYRTTNKDKELLEKEFGVVTYTDLDEALKEKPDVVFITNPTSLHIPISQKLAENGCHLFIEKPISHNMEGVEKLFNTVEKQGKVCFLAFCMRFHPNLLKIKELLDKKVLGKISFAQINFGSYLPDWHPYEDYRKSYAAIEKLGGGVLLTIIHEIDYTYWLFGEFKEVTTLLTNSGIFEMDVEDVVSGVATTKSGVKLEIHLDYLQKPPVRTCLIVGEKGKIAWDFFAKTVKHYDKETDGWSEYKAEKFDNNDMYVDELKHFLECVKENKPCSIPSKDVIDVMKIVDAIRESSSTKRTILLKD